MMNNTVEPHKASFGLDANMAVLIAYLGGIAIFLIPGLKYAAWVVPLVIFFMEAESRFIKFHAMQSFTLNLGGIILNIVISRIIGGIITSILFRKPGTGLGFISFLTGITTIVSIVIGIFVVVSAVNGWKYEKYKVPYVGDIAIKISDILGIKI